MKLVHFLVCFLVSLGLATTVIGSDGTDGLGLGKRALDLPAGGLGDEEESEDAPESIVFYGTEFEGDAFFWCFPAYGFCGETTVFSAIRTEVRSALDQLSPRAWMAFVGYNTATPSVWSYQAKKATTANKANAVNWMNTLVPIESHCLLEGALTTLQIANMTAGKQKKLH